MVIESYWYYMIDGDNCLYSFFNNINFNITLQPEEGAWFLEDLESVMKLDLRSAQSYSLLFTGVPCLQLSCCINDLNFCVHFLCHIGWVNVIYVGHVDRIDYTKPCSIL
jgi:hypothetical protein